ncbi:MAG: hypothetical protein ACXVC0_16380 [Bdellovibrionota bacterium]
MKVLLMKFTLVSIFFTVVAPWAQQAVAGATYPRVDFALWTTHSIPICIEPVSQTLDVLGVTDPAEREILGAQITRGRIVVQKALETEYNVKTGFHFSGFGFCRPLSSVPENTDVLLRTDTVGVRVLISPKDVGGRTKSMGQFINGQWAGVLVGSGSGSADCGSSQPALDRCLRANALHEIGHVLGLNHELDRVDTPSSPENDLYAIRTPKAVPLGKFDSASVMNYTAIFRMHSGLAPAELSTGDVQALLLMYKIGDRDPAQLSCLHDGGMWIDRPEETWSACCQVVEFESGKIFQSSASTKMCRRRGEL